MTSEESVVAQIWREVLGVPAEDPVVNFFELGGHSVLAVRVVSRLLKILPRRQPEKIAEIEANLLNTLFAEPTIRALARELGSALIDEPEEVVPSIPRIPRDHPIPLSHSQRLWWHPETLETGNIAFNIVNTIRLTGKLCDAALQASVGDLVRRHEPLRTIFVQHDGVPFQSILSLTDVPLPCIDLSGLLREHRQAERRRLVDRLGRTPFLLDRPPPGPFHSPPYGRR